jgi:hypothetical protein
MQFEVTETVHHQEKESLIVEIEEDRLPFAKEKVEGKR